MPASPPGLVSGNGSDTTFVNADARYQLTRDTGVLRPAAAGAAVGSSAV